MEYFQTTWLDGSSFNKGLTSEEYFYTQIFDAVKKNTANRTLPFFNTEADSIPVELTTGKIINDENMIALEMAASKNGYKSNVWLYGDTLEKLQNEGIRLNLKKGAEPVLCLTKYANATHLNRQELYIAEGGAGTKAQFLYNYDSLDDRSRKAVDKYFQKSQRISETYTRENMKNFLDNLKRSKKEVVPRLEKMKSLLKKAAESTSSRLKKALSPSFDDISVAPLINAQIRHMCQVNTGARIKNTPNKVMEDKCYSLLEQICTDTKETYLAGEALTKALEAGNQYAKACTSKDFNMEIRKTREEQAVKNKMLKNRNREGISY